MIAERHTKTPKRVLSSRGDRYSEMMHGSNLSDVAFFSAEIINIIFHEPLAESCRKVARFSGKVLRGAETAYDTIQSHAPSLGKIALRNETADTSSEPH